MNSKDKLQEEQILVRVTGQDRPGLTAAIMGNIGKVRCTVFLILVRQIFTQPFRSVSLSEQTKTIG